MRILCENCDKIIKEATPSRYKYHWFCSYECEVSSLKKRYAKKIELAKKQGTKNPMVVTVYTTNEERLLIWFLAKHLGKQVRNPFITILSAMINDRNFRPIDKKIKTDTKRLINSFNTNEEVFYGLHKLLYGMHITRSDLVMQYVDFKMKELGLEYKE